MSQHKLRVSKNFPKSYKCCSLFVIRFTSGSATMATVTSLKHEEIMHLAFMLDGPDRTWCDLGKQLLPECPKNEIEFLVHGYREE